MTTYNKYFTYPEIRIWEDGAWDDVVSTPAPLCRWIEGKNKELGRFMISPGSNENPPRGFNPKKISAEDKKYWEEKGMTYYACGLGGVSLVPSDYYYGKTEEPPVILCLTQGKRKSPTTRVHDIITYNQELCDMAASEKFAVIFAPSDGVDETDNYTQIIQEIASLAHLKVKKLWLDVSTVYTAGATLDSIPGFVLRDRNGNVIEDPDGLRFVDTSGRESPCSIQQDASGDDRTGGSLVRRVTFAPNGDFNFDMLSCDMLCFLL